MYLHVAWSLQSIDGESPEACVDALLSKRDTLLEQLEYFASNLPNTPQEGRNGNVLSCRVSLNLSSVKSVFLTVLCFFVCVVIKFSKFSVYYIIINYISFGIGCCHSCRDMVLIQKINVLFYKIGEFRILPRYTFYSELLETFSATA